MKLWILFAAIYGSSVFAETFANVSELPFIHQPSVEIVYGPPLAAVQPTGWVKFKYFGCKERQFDAALSETDGLVLVRIVRTDKPGVDCRAIIEHQASVQVSSDMNPSTKYVILNPQRALDAK